MEMFYFINLSLFIFFSIFHFFTSVAPLAGALSNIIFTYAVHLPFDEQFRVLTPLRSKVTTPPPFINLSKKIDVI